MGIEQYQEIVGAGWAFPLHVDGAGGIALARGENDIEQAIRIILGTARGERRMRPNFGCAIHDLVFAPNDESTWGLARYAVEEALGWWEPRIDVEEVVVGPNPDEAARLDIEILYSIRATKDRRTLVYPFYMITPEE
ncbi:MAG TPA: GPW/gp25 family protein [Dehalococcoidia bacterium]|nr:GPW/gp25 family protein [Dehalococcoidia bacterium]